MGFPIVLTGLDHRRCVVVGGGTVAARKVKALVDAGAHPEVISPDLSPELEHLVTSGEATVIGRAYQQGDLEGATLVVAATNTRHVNEAIANECRQHGILVNVVDVPDLCAFTLPSVIRRGDLLITVSTGGRSPAFARHMRETLEPVVDAVYGDMLTILFEVRPCVRDRVPRSEQRALWDELLGGGLMDCLRTDGMASARALAGRIVERYHAPPEETAAG